MDNRLLFVAKLIDGVNTVCDIGTDHAFLPIYLIENNKAKRVIASDINLAPLNVGQKNVIKAGVADKIELRLSCGFENYKVNEFDLAVIAGMGGETIAEIIDNAKIPLNMPLILQPMTCCDRLIDYLNDNGFGIIEHIAVKSDGRIYNIIKVIKNGEKNDSPIFNIVGKLDKTDPVALELLNKKLKSLIKMVNAIKGVERRQQEYIKASKQIELLKEFLS